MRGDRRAEAGARRPRRGGVTALNDLVDFSRGRRIGDLEAGCQSYSAAGRGRPGTRAFPTQHSGGQALTPHTTP